VIILFLLFKLIFLAISFLLVKKIMKKSTGWALFVLVISLMIGCGLIQITYTSAEPGDPLFKFNFIEESDYEH
jgi:drug/metabolite transporter (DMT)-like permease